MQPPPSFNPGIPQQPGPPPPLAPMRPPPQTQPQQPVATYETPSNPYTPAAPPTGPPGLNAARSAEYLHMPPDSPNVPHQQQVDHSSGPPMGNPNAPPGMPTAPPFTTAPPVANAPPIPGNIPPPIPANSAPPNGFQQPSAFSNNIPQQTGSVQNAVRPASGAPRVSRELLPGNRGGRPAPASPGSNTSRIDPNQIPRPPSALGHDPLIFETRTSQGANMPPLATSMYLVRDTGNCSPRNIRSTLNQVPVTSELLNSSNMPLAVIVQPLALLEPGEDPVQVVDFGTLGPVRCGRCKAYINPHMRFVDGGRRFQCNMCGFLNDTPREYQCNLGPDGRRQDAQTRPELSCGSVEYVAPAEYMVRPPMSPAFFFCVDVSHAALASGATAAACSSIARALASIPGQQGEDGGCRTRVGLLTFDSVVHFYNLQAPSGQPQMLVMGDVDEPYLPVGASSLLAPVSQVREELEGLLENIPRGMFQASAIPGMGGCAGAAVAGAFAALKVDGGKVLLFQTCMCTVGLGALKPRDGTAGGKTLSKDEKGLLKTTGPGEGHAYKNLAKECADWQVCVDMFMMTQAHVDLASMAILARNTGGDIHHYHPFNFQLDTAQLYNDLHWTLVRPQGMEAVMRVRCSTGLSVSGYTGSFTKHAAAATDIDLAAVDCNKAFVVSLKHEEKLSPEGHEACMQCALLYTTMTGERRIRVHTLSLPCTNVLGNLFRSADLDAQLQAQCSQYCQAVLSGNASLSALKEQAVTSCVNSLYSYRKFCATTSSSGQLILPEALKLLPLYTLAVQKGPLLRSDSPADVRVCYAVSFLSLSVAFVVPRIYPRLIPVLEPEMVEGVQKPKQEGPLPPPVALCSDKLDQQDIYVLENGADVYLWVGRQVVPEVVQELFNVNSHAELHSNSSQLQSGPSPLLQRVNMIVNEVRRQRCAFLKMRVLKRSDPQEVYFNNSIVEDRSQAGMSYVEFLCHIHRQIQNKFS